MHSFFDSVTCLKFTGVSSSDDFMCCIYDTTNTKSYSLKLNKFFQIGIGFEKFSQPVTEVS